MDYFASSFMFIILSCIIAVGSCDNLIYSMCWMFRGTSSYFHRSDGNLLLNDIALQSISKEGIFTSMTVSPNVNNSVTLKYPQVYDLTWTFEIQSTHSVNVTGSKRPEITTNNITQEAMEKVAATNEVFACEDGTLFFHQDENLIIAIGYTLHHPVTLESKSPSALYMSWEENDQPSDADPNGSATGTHTVTLYHPKGSSYTSLSDDADVSENYYHFTALESCKSYLACVEKAGTHFFTCVSSVTVPDSPRNFHMKSWNDSSITVAWEFPENSTFSLFLVTAFFLDIADLVVSEQALLHRESSLVFTLSGLDPCSRVKFGLQSVCQVGADSSYSEMVLMDGNSEHFHIEDLRLPSYGPDNYTLSWKAKSTNSSKSTSFRVYHQYTPQGSTLTTNFTVKGLQPCQRYLTTVEALCGANDVLMSAETLAAHTGPYRVLNLTYSSQDSTVWWNSTTTDPPLELGYLYELSFDNDTAISSGVVSEPPLHLPGLADGMAYKLNVWAECDGLGWQSDPALLCFVAVNVPDYLDLDYEDRTGLGEFPFGGPFLQMIVPKSSSMEFSLKFPFGGPFLQMIVPWSLAETLRDSLSEPRAAMEKIVKEKLDRLFEPPARAHIIDFAPHDGKTNIIFASDGDPTKDDQMDYIESLGWSNITANITEGIIYWNGPDECALVNCPDSSLCINTLGSYTCVCQHGYYDVGPVLLPPVVLAERPVCNERGLFSQHLNKFLASGIAKPYLIEQLGGNVTVVLNDGRCTVNETDTFFYFRIPRKYSQCGTERMVNETHTEYRVTMSVTLSKATTIVRREHKVVWKFFYPRKAKVQTSLQPQWLNIYSLVVFNSSQVLRLSLGLYADLSYSWQFHSATQLYKEEILFFELAVDVNDTFASDITMEVVSCWTTNDPDPNVEEQGIILLDGCPKDPTFHWLTPNGLNQSTRFSMEMFWMDERKDIYFHCLARICGPDEDCTTNCSANSSQLLTRRRRYLSEEVSERETVVSVGPLSLVGIPHVQPSSWTENAEMIAAVVGPVGFLLLAVLGVSATKAIMTYYEKLRLQ